MNKFYITTAIAYVNGAPHIGHALEFVQTDAVARYHRMKGDDTYFLTGTDEHGIKVFETAEAAGMVVKDFVDQNAKKFEDLMTLLNATNDGFVRTSSDVHKEGAKKIWKALADKGDIYKGSYEGKYCVGCEMYLSDRDMDEHGHCAIHKKKPKLIKEENYFFKLSAYSDQIREMIEKDELRILPESRKNEMLNIIGDGLRDVSFSRPKEQLPWGVDVPGDPSHVMYVWCDALSNYITAIGYGEESEQFKDLWPADYHVIGKDILRFHGGIWIGMLLSAGLEIPKNIAVHGFVTGDGEKMSKSLGNVVDPVEYVERYGVDAVRYYLLREIPTLDDGDFSEERFVGVHNSELANGVGNLLNRVVMMTDRFVGEIPQSCDAGEFEKHLHSALADYNAAFEKFDLKEACEVMVKLVDFANKYIDDKKPWLMAKEEGSLDELKDVMYRLLEALRVVAVMLYPIVPDSAVKIAKTISLEESELKLDYTWGQLDSGAKFEKGDLLFARIED